MLLTLGESDEPVKMCCSNGLQTVRGGNQNTTVSGFPNVGGDLGMVPPAPTVVFPIVSVT